MMKTVFRVYLEFAELEGSPGADTDTQTAQDLLSPVADDEPAP